MSKLLVGIGVIASSASLLLTTSCGGTLVEPSIEPPQEPITVALPYVEAVHFPAEVHAGQPFTMEFDLSCEAFPIALRSPERPFAPADLHFDPGLPDPQYIWAVLYRDLAHVNAAGPVVSEVPFTIPGLGAGEYNLNYHTARTRGEGGMQVRVDRLTWFWLDQDEGLFWHQVKFTVLP